MSTKTRSIFRYRPHPFAREIMEADGFVAEPPDWIDAGALMCDAETANEGQCEACCSIGLDLEPYHLPGRRQYRALTICRTCGHSEEF